MQERDFFPGETASVVGVGVGRGGFHFPILNRLTREETECVLAPTSEDHEHHGEVDITLGRLSALKFTSILLDIFSLDYALKGKVATYRHVYRAESKELTKFESVSDSEIHNLPFSHSGIFVSVRTIITSLIWFCI